MKKIILVFAILSLWGSSISYSQSKYLSDKLDRIEERIIRLEEGQKAVNQRIDSLEKRIEDLRAIMLTGFAILFSGMFFTVGFVVWDRRSALKPAINEIEDLKKRESVLEETLRKLAYQDEKIAAVLKSMNLL